jgi:uncharacterized protein YggE
VKKTIGLALILAVALGWSAGNTTVVSVRRLDVNGEGSVEAEPDLAVVRLGVTMDDPGAAAAYQECSAAMQKVIAALEKLGVAKADIRTCQLSLAPKEAYPQNFAPRPAYQQAGTSEMKGYTMIHLVAVTVRDLNQVSNVIDGASSGGANKMDGIALTFKDLDSLTSEARSRAFENAKKQAQDLARDAGVNLGKLESVREADTALPEATYAAGMSARGQGPTGSQQVRVSVSLSYELQ